MWAVAKNCCVLKKQIEDDEESAVCPLTLMESPQSRESSFKKVSLLQQYKVSAKEIIIRWRWNVERRKDYVYDFTPPPA